MSSRQPKNFLPTASTSLQESSGIQTHANYPRKLIIYVDDEWKETTDVNIIMKMDYLTFPYQQRDFPINREIFQIK